MTKRIQIGDAVAFNKLPDAVWFDVVTVDGYLLTVREAGADYAAQRIDSSLVKQHRTAQGDDA